jgi:membrane associated rhomboid family serine protease
MVEEAFTQIFGDKGKMLYLLLYVIALVVCLLPTYLQNKDNYHYRSLGASGAVSAVIFAGILIYPTMKIGLFLIPIGVPGFVFGPLFLIVSAYLAKKGHGSINHSAHIWGGIFGVVFLIICSQFLSDYRPVQMFVSQVSDYFKAM